MRDGDLVSMHCDNDVYGCLGVIRLLASVMYNNNFADLEEDWLVLRTLSKSVQLKLQSLHLWHYKDALAARNRLRTVVCRNYALSDLVCFVCLSN